MSQGNLQDLPEIKQPRLKEFFEASSGIDQSAISKIQKTNIMKNHIICIPDLRMSVPQEEKPEIIERVKKGVTRQAWKGLAGEGFREEHNLK